ncbi:hypothetical protein Hanom_Chr07g00655181 [Helianthus anomalus]
MIASLNTVTFFLKVLKDRYVKLSTIILYQTDSQHHGLSAVVCTCIDKYLAIYESASAISWSTTFGSANVLVSPSSSSCLEAIFLNILLIIFPLLVFGRPGAQ